MTRTPLCLALAAAVLCTALAQRSAASDEQVARGKYLVTTSGCHDCHTPWVTGRKGPQPDMTRALSGHPADFPLPPAPKPVAPRSTSRCSRPRTSAPPASLRVVPTN